MENINVNVNENKAKENREKRKSFARVANKRLGETVMQKCGEIAYIVEYVNALDITVQFKATGELVKTTYSNFVKGNVKSHFTATVYGIGITGLESVRDENGEQLDSYICWKDMLRRCYSAKFQEKQPTYIGCSVCDEWLYYSNFKKWYDNNYYEIDNKTSQLDKDILVKGNKIYSPDTCVFVPNFINKLFIKRQKLRGAFPIGVSYHKRDKKYVAQLSVFKDGKKTIKTLGYFDTPEEGFEVYKKNKEAYIKEIADEYKDKIPAELYKAMYDYRVDIND